MKEGVRGRRETDRQTETGSPQSHSQDLTDKLGESEDQNLGPWSQGYTCISGPSDSSVTLPIQEGPHSLGRETTALHMIITKFIASPS